MVKLAPSILSADFAALGAAIETVGAAADLLHVDVMDGHFVPNLTIGPPVVASIAAHTDLYLDCHLMMTNPGDYLEAFKKAGAGGCSVHVEIGGTEELLDEMVRLGLDVGLAVNPDTPFEQFERYLDRLDLVLLMTVFPGFGGQSFIADVLPKIEQTRAALDERKLTTALQVDGGIDEITAPRAAAAGADVFVAGSAVFGADDPADAAGRIRAAAERGRG